MLVKENQSGRILKQALTLDSSCCSWNEDEVSFFKNSGTQCGVLQSWGSPDAISVNRFLASMWCPMLADNNGKSGDRGESNFPLGSEHLKLRCYFIGITAKACLCSSALHPGSVIR